MKFNVFLLVLISVLFSGETTEHEYQSIHWVNLDTVKLQDHFLGELPELYGQNREGRIFNLLEIQDSEPWKVLIISYMAEWCGNCRYDAPVVKQVYEKYHPLGLNQIVVMEYSTRSGAEAFVDRYDLPMPVYFGQVRAKLEDKRSLSQHYILRKALADGRDWGTPFHIIIERGDLNRVGFVAGEFKRKELETYLNRRLKSREQ